MEAWLEVLGHLSKPGAVNWLWLAFIIYSSFNVFLMSNERLGRILFHCDCLIMISQSGSLIFNRVGEAKKLCSLCF